MKLERLEELKIITTQNMIVNKTVETMKDKASFNKYEIAINTNFVLATLFGNTEMHTAMAAKDIDWIQFANDLEQIVNGMDEEYNKIYKDLLEEISSTLRMEIEYNRSFGAFLKSFGELFSEENIKKIQETIETKVASDK